MSSYKGFICFIVKGNISQDGAGNERSDLFDLDINTFTDGSMTMVVVGCDNVTVGAWIFYRYILNALVRVASVRRSGLLFMQSNLKDYDMTLPSLSSYLSSSISMPNSKPRLSSHL